MADCGQPDLHLDATPALQPFTGQTAPSPLPGTPMRNRAMRDTMRKRPRRAHRDKAVPDGSENASNPEQRLANYLRTIDR
jgi:hypothetical protein